MNRLALTTGVFVGTALIGPAVSWIATVTLSLAQRGSSWSGRFVSDLVWLIWPAQLLGVVEASVGPLRAGLLAVGINMALFAVIGVLAGYLSPLRLGLFGLYGAVCSLVFLLALVGAGFALENFDVAALAGALVVYGLPCLTTSRLVQ